MHEETMRDRYRADRDAKANCVGDCGVCANGLKGKPCKDCPDTDQVGVSDTSIENCPVVDGCKVLDGLHTIRHIMPKWATLLGIHPSVDLKSRPMETVEEQAPPMLDYESVREYLIAPCPEVSQELELEIPGGEYAIPPEAQLTEQARKEITEKLRGKSIVERIDVLGNYVFGNTQIVMHPDEPGYDRFPLPSGRYLRYDLIPMDVLNELVEVFTFGEWKHVEMAKGEGQSWTAGVKYSQRINKILRHLMAFIRNEDIDPESGRHALAHMIVQSMMLLGMCIRGYKVEDDRYRLNGGKETSRG